MKKKIEEIIVGGQDVGTSPSQVAARVIAEQLRKVQGLLWSAEAEYKRKHDTGAVGSEMSWEELADFMWDQIREALEVLEEE